MDQALEWAKKEVFQISELGMRNLKHQNIL